MVGAPRAADARQPWPPSRSELVAGWQQDRFWPASGRPLNRRFASLIWQATKSPRFLSRKDFSPRWSPRCYIVGFRLTRRKFVLFDFETQKWTELAKGGMGGPVGHRTASMCTYCDSRPSGTQDSPQHQSDGTGRGSEELQAYRGLGQMVGSCSRRFTITAPRRRNPRCLCPGLGRAVSLQVRKVIPGHKSHCDWCGCGADYSPDMRSTEPHGREVGYGEK